MPGISAPRWNMMLSRCLEGLKLAMLPYSPSYRHMATEDLDLVLHLGGYVYEGGIPADGRYRQTPTPLAVTSLTSLRKLSVRTLSARFPWRSSDREASEAATFNCW